MRLFIAKHHFRLGRGEWCFIYYELSYRYNVVSEIFSLRKESEIMINRLLTKNRRSAKSDFRQMEMKVRINKETNSDKMKEMENEYNEMKNRVSNKLSIIRKK